MNRWRAVIVFSVAAMSVTARAEEAQPIYVERIEVRNTHLISPEVVVDASLLQPGRGYSLALLRDAEARLARMPYLHSASITTEEGSEPGRHLLVITVEEMRRFSFFADGRGMEIEADRANFDYAFSDPAAEWKDGALAVRGIVGRRGVAHFGMTVSRNRQAFSRNYSAWELGYTAYHLFGSHAFVNLNVRVPVDSVAERLYTPEVILGLPLTPRQTITLGLQDTLFRDHTVEVEGSKYRRLSIDRIVTAAWTWNTRNDAFAPTRGTFVRFAPVSSMKDLTSFSYAPPPRNFESRTEHVQARGFNFDALKYWELSDQYAVSAGLLGGWARVHDRQHSLSSDREVNWRTSHQVTQAGLSRQVGASRVGFDLRYFARQFSDSEGFHPQFPHEHSFEGELTFSRNMPWGKVRLGLGYARGEFVSTL